MVKEGQKRDSPCADSPDRDSGSAPDPSSIRNKEVGPRFRVRIMEFFFLKKIYENFVGTLETVRNREESVSDSRPYRKNRLHSFLPLIIM